MFADSGFLEFYNDYYRENVMVWPDEIEEIEIEKIEYEAGDTFIPIYTSELYACPEEYLLTRATVEEYSVLPEEFKSDKYFMEIDTFLEKCNIYKMYYPEDNYGELINDFEDVVDMLEIGDQFSVRYLETEKSFEDCRPAYDDVQKVFCANQYLNEIYDEYLVGIYIDF